MSETPKKVLLIGNNCMAPQLLHMIEKITTLPAAEILEAVGDPDKEMAIILKMNDNIRKEVSAPNDDMVDFLRGL